MIMYYDMKVDNQFLYSLNSNSFICPINKDFESNYTIYNYNRITEINVFDKNIYLAPREEQKLYYGKSIFINKFTDVLDLQIKKPSILLYLRSKKTIDYIWEFKKINLKANRIISVNVFNNRVQTTIKILNDIGNKTSIPIINKLCSNENHTTRWYAVSTLINLDYNLGIMQLKNMLMDVHPEIRMAAFKSLKHLE